MKTLRTFLALSTVFLLMISFGCSKQEYPVEPPTSSLSATQQTTFASLTLGNSAMAIDFTKSLSGGLARWTPNTPGKKIEKAPPQDWYGPAPHTNYWNVVAANGWYNYNYSYDLDSLTKDTIINWVKFTNDLWADSSAIVTRVDWEINQARDDFNTEYSAYATQQPGDSVHSGGWYAGIMINATGTVMSWVFTWTNVTETEWIGTPRTCSGSFSYTGEFGVSGTTTFTNGTGSGTAKCNGELFAKFTYNNDGTGYYTLIGDNYVQQYPFTW